MPEEHDQDDTLRVENDFHRTRRLGPEERDGTQHQPAEPQPSSAPLDETQPTPTGSPEDRAPSAGLDTSIPSVSPEILSYNVSAGELPDDVSSGVSPDDVSSGVSPDDMDTGELPTNVGEPTVAMDRMPTGATPTARLIRAVPPPQREGYRSPQLPASPPTPPPTSHPPSPTQRSRQTRAQPPAQRTVPGRPSRPIPPTQRPGYVPPSRTPPKKAKRKPRRWGRILSSALFILVVGIVLTFVLVAVSSVVGYASIAAQLPPPEELRNRQTSFVSSKIYDREGNLLYEVTDPQGGKRTYVSFDHISPDLINATVATEDRNFWLHPGFDPVAIARAIYYNVSEQRIVSGASTIPQQLARNVLLTPEERVQQTTFRKIKEAVLAAELFRTYDRQVILEIYLNEIYYGNQAYGIQAAAETYFSVDASELTLSQASFLAGLPQSPATYDPFGGGRDAALARQQDVLALMVEDGYISEAESALAAAEMRAYAFQAPRIDLDTAPHFVVYTRQTVEALYGPEVLYRNQEGKSLRIYTTLDPQLQRLAEQYVRDGVAQLADRNATNGALVAIEPDTGHIVAMVGSVDFYNEAIDGQVNVALRCRQPGSSIKPLTYLTSFEQGWTPATLLWDLETEFPSGTGDPYVPVNYDEKYHGPVLVRDALANSYNVPAVEALQFVGVEGLLDTAERMGVDSLVHPELYCPEYPYDYPPPYGLSLTLGGGETKLLEMTGAFAVLANSGTRLPPTPILRIEDSEGNVLVDNTTREGEQVITPQHTYLITDILSDTQARCAAFSCPSILELPGRPVAAKTGTTNDYRDAWTIGYTPDLVAGVWVGNSDNSEMINLAGASGAAPIWHQFMESAHADLPVRDFVRPPGIVEYEICSGSGAQPSEYCPSRKVEVFVDGQPPLDASHDWYQMVQIDNFTRLRANELCNDRVVEEEMVVIEDERGREWAQAHPERFGELPLAPFEFCTDATDRPILGILRPAEGEIVHGVVQIFGTIQMPNFLHYEVVYGVGDDPIGWGWISGPHKAQVRDGLLTEWDTSHLAPGVYTVRITAFDQEMRSVETRVHVHVTQPTKEPKPTEPPTSTPVPVPTLTPVPAATTAPTQPPTGTPVPTGVPTDTPPPTSTPIPTTKPTNTPGPTNTPPPTKTPISTGTPEPTSTEPAPTDAPAPTPSG
jgi:1A family penicillin-binding protein